MRQILALALLLASSPCFAGEEDLFGAPAAPAPAKASPAPAPAPAPEPSLLKVVPSGTLDVRFVHTGTTIGWEYGGPGITRYGAVPGAAAPGSIQGKRPDTSFKVPQVGLDLDFLLRDVPAAHLQLGYDDHPDFTGRVGSVGVLSAYILAPVPKPFAVRAGVLMPPFSLEHPGPAWSTEWTITPSAINTWFGEELRVVGVEGRWTGDVGGPWRLGAVAGVFGGNDPFGAVLAYRGWALHDWQMKLGDRLRVLADVPKFVVPNGGITPFTELDGAPGVYGKVSVARGDRARVELGAFHSLADKTVRSDTSLGRDYAWRTWFFHLGVDLRPIDGLTILVQGIWGATGMGAAFVVDQNFAAAYALASYDFGHHRLTYRYDWFEVTDTPRSMASYWSSGKAHTLAYFYRFNENHRVGVEYVRPDTYRPSLGYAGDFYDDLAQIVYRLRF